MAAVRTADHPGSTAAVGLDRVRCKESTGAVGSTTVAAAAVVADTLHCLCSKSVSAEMSATKQMSLASAKLPEA